LFGIGVGVGVGVGAWKLESLGLGLVVAGRNGGLCVCGWVVESWVIGVSVGIWREGFVLGIGWDAGILVGGSEIRDVECSVEKIEGLV